MHLCYTIDNYNDVIFLKSFNLGLQQHNITTTFVCAIEFTASLWSSFTLVKHRR